MDRTDRLGREEARDEFRALRRTGSATALADFQARHKLLLMAADPAAQKALGRVVATAAGRRPDVVLEEYGAALDAALAAPPSPGRHVNAIQHAQGYFADRLDAAEKRRFEALQEDYLAGRAPRDALLAVLREWVHRFGQPYLARQSYLFPPVPGSDAT